MCEIIINFGKNIHTYNVNMSSVAIMTQFQSQTLTYLKFTSTFFDINRINTVQNKQEI